MIAKKVKYEDFNGNEVEEVLHFNLTKAELTKLELGRKGGTSEYIKEAVESGDSGKLVDLFYNMLLDSYGVKSEDGKRFVKNARIREDFESSAAFSAIFMEIIQTPEVAESFFKAVTNQ